MNSDLLLKICSGTATDEENDIWKKQLKENIELMLIPENINSKLSESYSLGYSIAENFDQEKTGINMHFDEVFKEEIIKFMSQTTKDLEEIKSLLLKQ